MLARFAAKGDLIESLLNQKLVMGDHDLAAAIADRATIQEVTLGEVIITQGAFDDAVFFILVGTFSIVVNEKEIAQRTANDHVGEMSIVNSSLPRSATVIAWESGVVAKLSAPDLTELANAYPSVWREIAKTLANGLYRHNKLVTTTHESIRVFIVSPLEMLPVARAVEKNFAHDAFFCKVWTEGVFLASQYAVESLEQQLEESDFAIAIAPPDDQSKASGNVPYSLRDEVIFELGLFVGRLGRHRSFLLEPNEDKVKLPPNLSGLITIPYSIETNTDLDSALASACKQLRSIFTDLGPNNY